MASFDHSPRSCKGLATEILTNEYCPLSDLSTARQMAMSFAEDQPEPVPFVIVEVLLCPAN